MELGLSVLIASQVEGYLLEEVHDSQHGKDVKVELPQQLPLNCLVNNESGVINITRAIFGICLGDGVLGIHTVGEILCFRDGFRDSAHNGEL